VSAPPVGAYGLRVAGLDHAGGLLQRVPPEWPELVVRTRAGRRGWEGDAVEDERAFLELHDGGGAEIVRAGLRAVVFHPEGTEPAGLVHPYLAPIAAVVNRWLGRESFHAGAFVAGGGAWGVLGDRGDGKSSLLAGLALEGAGVVADDVVVVESDVAFAGPRTLDLRADAAAELGAGEPLGRLGTRDRWRVALDAVPVRMPLRGWVVLEWDDELSLEALPASERLLALGRQRAVRLPPTDPGGLLRLAALPGYVLRRPRDWGALAPAADLLLRRLGERPSPATPPATG
jgi:hypothetical protein